MNFIWITSILIDEAIESKTSILLYFFNSHDLAVKAYGADVKAPTGHKSIIYLIIHHL